MLESVLANPSEVVEVEHRGLQGRVLLVNSQFRDYVRQLEQALRALVSTEANQSTFQLAGSLSVTGDVEHALEVLRAEERRIAVARFDAL